MLVKAISAAGSAFPTVNGVTFTPFPGTDAITGNNASNLLIGALPTGGAISAAYATLLSQNVANNTTGSTLTLTLNGLTVGAHYELQFWFHDANATGQGTLIVKSPGNVDPWVKLDANPGNSIGGRGQFALGTFTADAVTQTITLQGSVNPVLQAYQLRRITDPLAAVVWEGWRESGGSADVATTGNGVRAYGFGSTLPSTALNGVSFTAFSAQSTDTATGWAAAPTDTFTSIAAPFSTMSADYRALLGNGATGGRSASVTFNQLQPGQWYLLLVWANDSRALGGGRKQRVNGSLWLNSNPGLSSDNLAYEGGLGHWMQGAFQATSTAQRLEFDANSAVQLNALQLRAIPAPDPYVHAFRYRRLRYLAAWLDGRVPMANSIIWSQPQAWFATGDFVAARADATSKSGATAAWSGVSHFEIWPAVDLVARRAKYLDALTRDRILTALRRFGYLRSTSNFAELALSTRLLASTAYGEDSLLHPQNDITTSDPTGRTTFLGRSDYKALNGCGEYASSPYGWYNILPSLSVAQLNSDPVVRTRAQLAFDACLAQLASVWMPDGYLATFSGRSYPEGAYNGLSRMLWLWFGDAPTTFTYQPQAAMVAAMEYTPPPALLHAAGERTSIYTSRHSFDAIQTAYIYKDQYGIYSHEDRSGGRQQYQDGVRWKGMKNSYLWLTKPNDDDPALVRVSACHGTVSGDVGTVQHKDAILMAFDMSHPKVTPYPYALAHIPGIYLAMSNRTGANTPADGRPRIFVHYGTVMAVISADIPFTWDPNSGVYCNEMPTDPGDSELRVAVGGVGNPLTNPTGFMSTIDAPNNRFAMAIETAHPEEFPAADPAAQLAAFESAILAQTALRHEAPSPTVAYYTTRRGERLKVQAKTGAAYPIAAAINDVAVDYVNWPTNESPWVSQLRQNPAGPQRVSGGNVTLTAGRLRTVLDVFNWARTDSVKPGSTTTPEITAAPAAGVLPTSAYAVAELTSTGSSATALTCYWGPTDAGATHSGWAQSLALGNRSPGTVFASLTGLSPGSSYVYRFAAANTAGTVWSAPINFQASAVPPPGVPTGLRFTLTANAIPLAWDAAAEATSYTVKRATTFGGPFSVRQSGLTSPNFTDTSLTPDTTYYYVVTAVNAGGESAPSGQLAAATAATPAVPTGVTAVTGYLYPRVSWTASPFATHFIVKRASASAGPYTTLVTDVADSFFDDTTAANLTTYYYKVAAANFAGISEDSAAASVTVTLASAVLQTSGAWSTGPWYPAVPGRPTSGNTTVVDFFNPDTTLTSQQNLGAFTLRQLRFLGRDVTLTGDALTLAGTTPMFSVAATGAASVANALTLSADATFGIDGQLTLSGPLSGPGALTKTGPGTLRFSTNPGYSGNTILDGGTTIFAAPAPAVKTLFLGRSINASNPSEVVVDADVSVTGLTVQTTGVTNLLTIAAGRTFTINGPFLGGGLTTGALDSHLTVSGPGAFVFNSSTAPFVVRHGSLIDLGAAGEVRITTPRLLIGDSDVRPSTQPATLTVSAHGLTRLQADTIHLDGVSVGGTTSAGESATFLAPAGAGRLVIRNTAGTGPATLSLNLRGGQSSVASYTTFDLRGHDSDLLLDTLDIAHRSVSYGGGPGSGSFFFDTGTLTVTGRTRLATSDLATVVNSANVIIGGGTVALLGGLDVATTTTGQRIAASFTLEEGTMTSGKITLATASHGVATADLVLNGGSLTVTDDIIAGLNTPAPDGSPSTNNARVLLDGTVLDLTGHALGTTAAPLTLLSLQSGELRNVGSIAYRNGTDVLTGLTKTDITTLTLSGLHTYTGPTSVQNGTLAIKDGTITGSSVLTVELLGALSGTGTINAPVNIKGDFLPGNESDPAGTLALTGTVTLASTSETFFSIDRAVTPASARVTCGGLTCGGTLHVTNLGAALQAGDRFVLFSSAVINGGFNAFDLPSLPSGLAWDKRGLFADGSIIVRTAAEMVAQTDNGTWNVNADGLWSLDTNWLSNTIANGEGCTANFTHNITADRTVHLDGDRTLSNLVFSDSDTATAGSWLLDNNGTSSNNLILAGTIPTITVNALGTNKTATISAIIEGTAGLAKAGTGTLVLSGANTYTGTTTVAAGTLSYSTADIAANPNSLGQSGNAASNLLLGNGTTLQYTGAGGSTDRLFTINGTAAAHGATLNASGTGAISYTNIGAIAYGTSAQTRTLTLTGTNTGSNTLAAAIVNNGTAAVSVAKTSTGTWNLSGANTYTGDTTLNGGTLALTGQNNGNGNFNIAGANSILAFNSGAALGTGLLRGATGGSSNFASGLTFQTLGTTPIAVNLTGWTGAFRTNSNANANIKFASGAGSTAAITWNTEFDIYATGTHTITVDNVGGVTFAGNFKGATYGSGTSNPVFKGSQPVTITGVVSGGGSSTLSLAYAGGSRLTLANSANGYTGVTTVESGTIVAGANAPSGAMGALGNATSAIVLGNASTAAAGAPSLLINGAFTVGRAISVGSLANANAYNATIGGGNTTGTSTFTGNITLDTTAANYTATLQAATGGTVEFKTGIWTTNNKAIAIGSPGNAGTVKLSNDLTTTGGISVNYGTLQLAATGSLWFKPTTHGTSNKVTGAGTAQFHGTLKLDLSSAAIANGNSWTLVDVASPTYGLAGIASTSPALAFTNNSGVWTAVDGGNTWTFTQSTGTLTITLASSGGFANWINTNLPSLSSKEAAADPDGDGIKNLMEYVLNSDPGVSGTASLPTLTSNPANFIFTYSRRMESASDTTQTFESTADLSFTDQTPVTVPGATPGTFGAVTVGSPAGISPNQVQTITITIPKGANTKLFGRLKVTKP